MSLRKDSRSVHGRKTTSIDERPPPGPRRRTTGETDIEKGGDPQVILESLAQIDNNTSNSAASEIVNKEQAEIKNLKDIASAYIVVSVFVASAGIGLLSYAHDNTSGSSSGTTFSNITSDISGNALDDITTFNQCSPQIFQVAESICIVSIFYAFFSTLVSLYGTSNLGIGWQRAILIGLKKRSDDNNQDNNNINSLDNINEFLDRLYSAKLLLNVSIWALIISLFFTAFCVMTPIAFAVQWLFALFALIFVMRAWIIGVILKPFHSIGSAVTSCLLYL